MSEIISVTVRSSISSRLTPDGQEIVTHTLSYSKPVLRVIATPEQPHLCDGRLNTSEPCAWCNDRTDERIGEDRG